MKKNATIGSLLVILFGVCVAFIIMIATSKEHTRITGIEQEINTLQEKADQINGENNDLKEKIAYFKTDEFKEREAKEKLNYQKEGERVVIVKNRTQDPPAQENAEEINEIEENIPNHIKWWHQYF